MENKVPEAECLHHKTCKDYEHYVREENDMMIATFCDDSRRCKTCPGNPDYEDTLKSLFLEKRLEYEEW